MTMWTDPVHQSCAFPARVVAFVSVTQLMLCNRSFLSVISANRAINWGHNVSSCFHFLFRGLVAVLSSYDATCGFTSRGVAAQFMNHREHLSMCAGSKMTLPWPMLHKSSLFWHIMFCSAEPAWISFYQHFRLSVARGQPGLVVWHQLRHPTEQHGQCHLRVFSSVLSEKTVGILLILAIIPNLPTLQVDITLACLCLLTLTSYLTLMRFLLNWRAVLPRDLYQNAINTCIHNPNKVKGSNMWSSN